MTTSTTSIDRAPGVTAFASLFPGLKRAHGALHGECVKQPLTLALYQDHLDGRNSLGVYPLTDDGAVRFGAVDEDTGDARPAFAVADALHEMGVNTGVQVFTSRRKGHHIILFFAEWVPASEVRRILRHAVLIAGLDPRTEVFPKQDRIPPTDQDGQEHFGNYLNLPYFAGGQPGGRRMALEPETHEPIPLDTFLANIRPFPTAALDVVLDQLPPEEPRAQRKSPEALSRLFTDTYPERFRRASDGLPSAVGVLRSRGIPEDAAVALLVPWAREHFDPPLADEEVEQHVRSMYVRYGASQGESHRARRGHLHLPPITVEIPSC